MASAELSDGVVIASAAVAAPVLAELVGRLRVPVVVLEIVLGILIGPQVLHWADVAPFINMLSQLGLAFLMFLAGYEAEPRRIRGRPLNLAATGWLLSLVLGLGLGALLVWTGRALSALIVGLALTTTSLGTLLPILRDSGLAASRFGTFVLAAGTVGEFGPIVAVALLLTSDAPLRTAILLVGFVVVALAAAWAALRPLPSAVGRLMHKHLESSAQLPVRMVVLLLLVLVWLASSLGLDVLLGSFAAGLIARLASRGPDVEPVKAKLEGLGFGFLIPFFFVVTGMNFDLDALTSSAQALLRLPLFLVLFLVVRGTPALLCRRDLDRKQVMALGLMSATALPLVVVITNIGVTTHRMTSANAASLVGAAMASVLLFPLLASALLRAGRGDDLGPAPAGPAAAQHSG